MIDSGFNRVTNDDLRRHLARAYGAGYWSLLASGALLLAIQGYLAGATAIGLCIRATLLMFLAGIVQLLRLRAIRQTLDSHRRLLRLQQSVLTQRAHCAPSIAETI